MRCILFCLAITCCAACAILQPGRFWRIWDPAGVTAAFDTAQTRELIRAQGARNEQFVGRGEFLEAMAKMPGFLVPYRSQCEVVERSRAACGPPLYNELFVKVRITTGPMRGKEGWVCSRHEGFP